MKQRESGLPFDDIRNLTKNLPEMDADALNHTASQLDGDESYFGELCKWYSACSGRSPAVHRPAVTLFAGTHALENSLDNNASSDALLGKVTEISAGSAYINRLCHQHDVGLKVFDLALQIPVDDISNEAALDEKSCAGTIAFGMEAIAGGTDLLCVAALEVKPTVSALAILHILGDVPAEYLFTQRNDNIEESFNKAVANAQGHKANSLEVLRRLGGRETAAICGAILAARSQHIPVIIDGITALAAALVIHKLEPSALDHVKFAQGNLETPIIQLFAKDGVLSILSTQITDRAEEGLLMGAGVLKSACLKLQGKPRV